MDFIPEIPAGLYLLGFYRTGFIYAGFIMQAGYLFYRGTQLGRLPIVGPHDTLYFLSVSTVLFGLAMTFGLENRRRHLSPIAGLAIFFTLVSFLYPPFNSPMPPVLKTFWFESHVTLSFFSYALFGIAAAFGANFIIQKRISGDGSRSETTAAIDNMEVLQYKAILVGYCLFSAAMVFGGIWAYLAWGTYWLWTPKELWTVILWLFYSLYLHARLRQWWSGKPSAVLGIIGFAIVLFTYLGVSLFMKSSHTF